MPVVARHSTLNWLTATRVEQALLQDAERLDLECHRYREAVKEEESRLEIYKRTATDDGDLDAQEAAYQLEIAMLQEAVEAQEAEIRHLRSIQREQRLVEEELDQIEDALESQQNALELEARAFDNEQEQLYLQLSSTHAEAQRLSSSSICLPSILFRLQVDTERGLRYPLINDLRLAYRPKGDVRWDEIQAAWALAAQLLLTIGVTFQFQSMNWKLVPLSHCAKLIFYPVEGSDETKKRPVVYNLGHPRTDHSKSLLAWNGLLYQMVRHTTIKVHTAVDNGVLTEGEIPPLPFEISATKIGAIVLARLGADDDAGWSRAIHCMSCNLLWLSECAATFILQKVVLTAGSYA